MKKMYYIRMIRFRNGEDFPIMFDGETRMPLFYPTVYTVGQRRKYTILTLEQNLRHIMLLYTWAKMRDIDIEHRYLYDDFLTDNECGDLLGTARLYHEDIVNIIKTKAKSSKRKTNVIDLKKYMYFSKSSKNRTVSNNVTLSRILTIRDYLDRLASKRIYSIGSRNLDLVNFLKDRKAEISRYLKNNAPKADRKSVFDLPKGISPKDERYLFDVLDPTSDMNPWKDPAVGHRNQLLFIFLFDFGMRLGEALSIKLTDLDLRENIISIPKRPDDPDDIRTRRARQKTQPRKLAVSSEAKKIIKNYYMHHRKSLRGGKVRGLKHSFLLVSTFHGDPLSISMVQTIFEDLKKVPGIPRELTTHTGRHNWNDRFSALIDKKNEDPSGEYINSEQEQMMRNYFMGWSRKSEMAETYARRHNIKKAQEYDRQNAKAWIEENIVRDKTFLEALDLKLKRQETYDDILY